MIFSACLLISSPAFCNAVLDSSAHFSTVGLIWSKPFSRVSFTWFQASSSSLAALDDDDDDVSVCSAGAAFAYFCWKLIFIQNYKQIYKQLVKIRITFTKLMEIYLKKNK